MEVLGIVASLLRAKTDWEVEKERGVLKSCLGRATVLLKSCLLDLKSIMKNCCLNVRYEEVISR